MNLENNFFKPTEPRGETISNKESNDEEDKKEKNKELKINFHDKGYDLESRSYNFEYPERFQKETGILGYERTIITEDSLFKVVESYLREIGIDPQEAKRCFLYDFNKKINCPPSNVNYDGVKVIRDLFTKILSSLSDNEYPLYTLNHQFGGDYSNDEQMTKAIDILKKGKIFSQKIFSNELLSENKKQNGSTKLMNIRYTDITFESFDKKSADQSNKLDDNNKFVTTGNKGLNFLRGSFFRTPAYLSFGFSAKEDMFEEYLEKCLKYYYCNDIDKNLPMIKKITTNIILDRDYVKDFFETNINEISTKNNDISSINGFKELEKKIDETIKSIFKKINVPDDWIIKRIPDFSGIVKYRLTEYSYNIIDAFRGKSAFVNTNFEPGQEPVIPIFINHDEIPQLCWGHAKYAHFVSDKGFNFIKFKHAEKLPRPIDVKSE